MSTQPRILVIRGGAIGDFILTLPAIRLLRENFPGAHLEILGYKHIVALAEGRFYSQATRSIEYSAMAGFFVPNSELAADLVEYFASFQQVVSYLSDPYGYFEANLRKAGVKNFLPAYSPPGDELHAAHQLAAPLEKLALFLDEPGAVVFPTAADAAAAAEFLQDVERPLIAIHPGSGSSRKNWPIEKWIGTARALAHLEPRPEFLWVGGEADEAALGALHAGLGGEALRVARHLPLPHLAAVLARCRLFLGHDSGISHLAAAVGTPCVLLFGPTDPAVWAPAHGHVAVIEAPGGFLGQLAPAIVVARVVEKWAGLKV
jgi:heptosyltransferase-2